MSKIGLVIMASGKSQRMGQDKLMLPLNGKQLYEYVLLAARGAGFDGVCVVSTNEEILLAAANFGFHAIKNDIDNCGKSSSIKLGLQCLNGMDTVFFLPCDQPLITSTTLNQLIKASTEHTENIVIPIYGDTIGSPVGFPSGLFDDLFKLTGDNGGKSIIAGNTELVKYVHISDTKQGLDVDYAKDMENMTQIFQNISIKCD